MIELKLSNDLFEFMPKAKELLYLSEEEKIKLIKSSSENLNSNHQYYNLCKNVIDSFYERLTSKNINYLWNINDYKKAKFLLIKIRNNQIQYLEEFIINILKIDNKSIIKELSNFSKMVEWYPEKIRIKDGDGFTFKDEEIEVTDIFLVSARIVSFMQRNIKELATNLLETGADFNTTFELIKEIRDDKIKSEINLKKFDEEYSFLEECPLLKIIYQKVRANYYNILLDDLRLIYNKQNQNRLQENYRKNYLAKIERRKEKKAIYDKKRSRTNYY